MKLKSILNILILFGIVSIIAIIAFWNFYYTDIKAPIIKEGKTSISGLDGWVTVESIPIPTEVTFTATKIVENQNPFTIEIIKVEYEYYINDNFIGNGKIPHKYEIPANSERNIPIEIKLDLTSLPSIIKTGADIIRESEISIKVYTDVYATAPFRKTVVVHKWSEREIKFSDLISVKTATMTIGEVEPANVTIGNGKLPNVTIEPATITIGEVEPANVTIDEGKLPNVTIEPATITMGEVEPASGLTLTYLTKDEENKNETKISTT